MSAAQSAAPGKFAGRDDIKNGQAVETQNAKAATTTAGHYKGFVAGVFSGIAKLSVGHPFDTVKVRLQTSPISHFKGPLDCVVQTLRKEGPAAFYKGASPPLIGWMFMDSLLMGSMTFYRRILQDHVFAPRDSLDNTASAAPKLPTLGHALAGMMAGWTVSFIAAPVEHVKARLQVQYSASKEQRLYKGPIDCASKLLRNHGIAGLYHGLFATIFFRTWFFAWWGSYDILTRYLSAHTSLSTPAINFWAGGLSSQVFWITSYPSDVIKQRIMTDELGPGRKFPHWRHAAVAIWREGGLRGYFRGFVPSFLRAFPANGMALVAFEGVMRTLH